MINTLISLTALTFLVLLIRYLFQLLINHYRLAAQAKQFSDLEAKFLQVRINQVMDQLRFDDRKDEASWNGFRKFQIILKVNETEDVCSFYLAPHDSKKLPPFLPGQHLTLKLNIPGQAKPVIRCYSLSDSPNHPDYYRVTIKKISEPDDVPEALPGLVSNFFHDSLRERDILDIKAPSGHFTLDMSKDTPVVLIGGGIGVTPVIGMLNTITEKGSLRIMSNRETWFFMGVHNHSDHLMKDHLERIGRAHKNVHMHVCYSQPTPNDIKGRDYQHGERITVDLLKRVLPHPDFDFFICAPSQMIEDLRRDLAAWGVKESNVHYEAFGSATIKKLSTAETGAIESTIQVTFTKSGKTLNWDPTSASILEFAEENGINLEFGCRTGNCGTCVVSVKSGLTSYVVDPGIKPEVGSCLACIAVPKTNLTLDA